MNIGFWASFEMEATCNVHGVSHSGVTRVAAAAVPAAALAPELTSVV